MKGIDVYSKIKQLKESGFSKRAVAEQLGIHRATVDRYWNMDAPTFGTTQRNVSPLASLAPYEHTIIGWLRDYQTLSAAQVGDWLGENYNIKIPARTVSRYVKELRLTHNLEKKHPSREYSAVPELPAGRQLQADFGEMWMPCADGGRIKVRFAAFVLAHSRNKYLYFQSRPFKTQDFVRACTCCFAHFGGMPYELVIDQDSIIVVSENKGDIIYTHEFELFRQACALNIHVCRRADPESKGKIENVVRYVKGNFLGERLYPGDDALLQECAQSWLDRTGNNTVHGTTKKVPKEHFAIEQQFLRPLVVTPACPEQLIFRTVRKDNTIVYGSNRYTLPFGTYSKHKEVCVRRNADKLHIETSLREPVCIHPACSGNGILVSNKDHYRDKQSSIDALEQELRALVGSQHSDFIAGVRREKSRYVRDHFLLLKTLVKEHPAALVTEALEFCAQNSLYSVVCVRDFLVSKQPYQKPILPKVFPLGKPKKYHVETQKRPLSEYSAVGGPR